MWPFVPFQPLPVGPDEFTRESLAGHVARHITAKDTVAVLEGPVEFARR